MNQQALAAAFRVLQSTPRERVHTHERDFEKQIGKAWKPTTEQTLDLNRKIRALEARGYNGVEIADKLEVSKSTVSKHLRRALAILK